MIKGHNCLFPFKKDFLKELALLGTSLLLGIFQHTDFNVHKTLYFSVY